MQELKLFGSKYWFILLMTGILIGASVAHKQKLQQNHKNAQHQN